MTRCKNRKGKGYFMKRRYDEVLAEEIVRPAKAETMSELVEFVSDHIAEYGFPEDRIEEICKAAEEALRNIIDFAPAGENVEIRIKFGVHNGGGLFITIIDTGKPFNVLLASILPEMEGLDSSGRKPSTTIMKKVVRNIEYKRGENCNILIFTIPGA